MSCSFKVQRLEEQNRSLMVNISSCKWQQPLKMKCGSWDTIGKLKNVISGHIGLEPDQFKLLAHLEEMSDNIFLNQLTTCRKSTFPLHQQISNKLNLVLNTIDNDEKMKVILGLNKDHFQTFIDKINKAFNKKIKAKSFKVGTSGLYQLLDINRNIIGFFKPIDEEPVAVKRESFSQIPRKNSHDLYKSVDYELKLQQINIRSAKKNNKNKCESIRKGIYEGELASREIFAYMLDEDHIHGVPPTTMVEIDKSCFNLHTQAQVNIHTQPQVKKGSFQKFIPNNGIASNMASRLFPVYEVQKIALLDLRILNCDRNESNIIFKKDINSDYITLFPIDHGLSLPDTLEFYDSDLCWIYWHQAKLPIDPLLVNFIQSIDPKKDYERLKNELEIREPSLINFRLAQIFIQKSTEKKLSLFQMATLMYRSKETRQSPFEILAEQAQFTYKCVCGEMSKQFYYNLQFSQGTQKQVSQNSSSNSHNTVQQLPSELDFPETSNLQIQHNKSMKIVNEDKQIIHYNKSIAYVNSVSSPPPININQSFFSFKNGNEDAKSTCSNDQKSESPHSKKSDSFQQEEGAKRRKSTLNMQQEKILEELSLNIERKKSSPIVMSLKNSKRNLQQCKKSQFQLTSSVKMQNDPLASKKYLRSLSIQNSKQSAQTRCTSFENQIRSRDSLLIDRNKDDMNEMFFYFFECQVEQFLKKFLNRKIRRYTCDNSDFNF